MPFCGHLTLITSISVEDSGVKENDKFSDMFDY